MAPDVCRCVTLVRRASLPEPSALSRMAGKRAELAVIHAGGTVIHAVKEPEGTVNPKGPRRVAEGLVGWRSWAATCW